MNDQKQPQRPQNKIRIDLRITNSYIPRNKSTNLSCFVTSLSLHAGKNSQIWPNFVILKNTRSFFVFLLFFSSTHPQFILIFGCSFFTSRLFSPSDAFVYCFRLRTHTHTHSSEQPLFPFLVLFFSVCFFVRSASSIKEAIAKQNVSRRILIELTEGLSTKHAHTNTTLSNSLWYSLYTKKQHQGQSKANGQKKLVVH